MTGPALRVVYWGIEAVAVQAVVVHPALAPLGVYVAEKMYAAVYVAVKSAQRGTEEFTAQRGTEECAQDRELEGRVERHVLSVHTRAAGRKAGAEAARRADGQAAGGRRHKRLRSVRRGVRRSGGEPTAVRGGGAWCARLWRALGWLWETVMSSENRTSLSSCNKTTCNEKRTSSSLFVVVCNEAAESARREGG